MLYITEKEVLTLLNWDEIFKAIEIALKSVTKKRVIQNPRSLTQIPETQNILFSMPGFIGNNAEINALACKLVTSFPENTKKGLPSILANILLFNQETGQLQAVIDATEITSWRTAAASAVATKYLTMNKPKKEILAILGSGIQAKIHILAFQHFFKFKKVKIWGRTQKNVEKLIQELGLNEIELVSDPKSCVENADVVITTTYAKEPILKFEWLKSGYHICAVGAGSNPMEIDLETYQNAHVYVDHLSGAKEELKHLLEKGVVFKNEIGALIEKIEPYPVNQQNTVFQSLGMAVEDCVVAQLIYSKFINKNN
nr:ketimine reductase mu-crystallin [Onthophagus taurus]